LPSLISYLSVPSGFAINFFIDDLLQRIARDRDPMAFQELFRLYSPRIKAMMMRQGADAAASEDIAQEALFIVWRKAHLFVAQKGASQLGFIHREESAHRPAKTAGALSGLAQEMVDVASDDDLADEALNRSQERERIRKVFETLPAEQYEVVRLSYTSKGSPTTRSSGCSALPSGQ